MQPDPRIVRDILTNDLVETTTADVLVEDFYPGQPVMISFAFVDWNGNPHFDFFGRVKKLEASNGRKINKIYLRDRTSSWYQNGVPGLGTNAFEMAEGLAGILRGIQSKRVVTIGQSMGAYGAILTGLLLNVHQIVTFGVSSAIDFKLAEKWNDYRYHSALIKLPVLPANPKYLDLLPVLRVAASRPSPPAIDLYFGTFPSDTLKPGDIPLNQGAVHLDALHAERISAAFPNSRLHPFPQIAHLVAQHLASTGEMDIILRRHLLDA